MNDHNKKFATWFKNEVDRDGSVSRNLKVLARGPSYYVFSYVGYIINGVRFSTQSRDNRCKTQNCGVKVSAMTSNFSSAKDSNPIMSDRVYYGDVMSIIELDYYGSFTVILFKCKWYKWKKDEYDLIWVDKNVTESEDDPFIEASLVKQVFYVNDAKDNNMFYIVQTPTREYFETDGENIPNYEVSDAKIDDVTRANLNINISELEADITRTDVESTIIDQPINEVNKKTYNEDDNLEQVDEYDFDDSDGAVYGINDGRITVDQLVGMIGEELQFEPDLESDEEETDLESNDEKGTEYGSDSEEEEGSDDEE